MASRVTFSSPHHTVNSRHNYDLCHGMDEPLQGDRVLALMGSYVDGGLMLSPITWTKPRYQWCEGTSVAGSPKPSRYLLVEPLYVRDSSPAGGHQRSKEAQDFLYVTDRRGSIRIPATAFRRGNFARAGGAQETTDSNTHRNTSKGGVDSKWHFTVDVKDCSDVHVSIDGDKLTVEGNGFNCDCNYQKSVRYETILPSHCFPDWNASTPPPPEMLKSIIGWIGTCLHQYNLLALASRYLELRLTLSD
ncbi:hypothetical protein E2C01_044022 [Portunus trituberculatus]|uniref:Uncharacterized protein n=1 Tax=Portunus trituberculatus TaxID=210409 RepID=A0A5B7FYA8_PORTR|nr:hypothetical protein [Portunus trituberculatus]